MWALKIDIIGMPGGAHTEHLLLVLLFLKIYITECADCTIVGGSGRAVLKRIFQKRLWLLLFFILYLHLNLVSK